ncbi:MSE1 [Candida theae]|uniref:Glutamate--tRNA ligase, mitochondrial n=1 Tax=Candida theae TaxID=1198502 RepID=A0AAD5FW01_9ASCO|nr:MSE1 [Candida theae]KAI5948864.1 MSE1 [Candida theae]
MLRYPTRLDFRSHVWHFVKCRFYSQINLEELEGSKRKSIHPYSPARTRFAPSPTGFLHLGSLRTALYNYLLAKNTGGQFVVRLEDTDQKRLVDGAERNIFDTLDWCKLDIDESPVHGGPYGPYKQSERKEIYQKYAQHLLDQGLAYKCFCPKERLLELRESARLLKPPTNVTYDRKCLSNNDSGNGSYIIRFKSPHNYPKINDLLHGELNLQPQYNSKDQRYDDFVIIKNDGMPTYHFANVVDDHLMKITHVIRGDEWLPSTPKHIALYDAFGWSPPKFIHIPLLTSLQDKKLSKRKGDFNILSLREQGILPQALVNFVALFGWAPPRELNVKSSELFDLDQLVKLFSLDQLTKGNAKVSDSKLHFLQKEHFQRVLQDEKSFNELVDEFYPEFAELSNGKSKEYFLRLLHELGPSLDSIDGVKDHRYLFENVDYTNVRAPKDAHLAKVIVDDILEHGINDAVERLTTQGLPKKLVFMTLRSALSGGKPGLPIPALISLLGEKECLKRLVSFKDTLL